MDPVVWWKGHQAGNGYCWLRRTDGNTSDKYASKSLTPQSRSICEHIDSREGYVKRHEEVAEKKGGAGVDD